MVERTILKELWVSISFIRVKLLIDAELAHRLPSVFTF